jgi:hypothetical protein
MTTVVIENPITKLRMVIEQIFQGINNLFFDKEVNNKKDPKARGADQYREIREPKKYIQKGGIKQMCDEKPYEEVHAYGLVYNYEEEKVAPSFSGPQFQIYLERATELCDDDPDCRYFNLWTDGGITKYKDCAKLKDTVNSTLTYEKIPNPPVIGTECEDKGSTYNWYDFKRGNVDNHTGAGEANAEWDENGNCVRVSCKDPEKKELDALKKCVPTDVQQLSDADQKNEMVYKRERNLLAKDYQKRIDMKKGYADTCYKDVFNSTKWCRNGKETNKVGSGATKCPGQETIPWHPANGKRYDIGRDKIGDCQRAADNHVDRTWNPYDMQDDGLDEDWSQLDRDDPYAASGWW